jgi:hypothetical protein
MRLQHHLRPLLERVKQLSPRWTLVLGFAVFLAYAFPGYMSTDSVIQLDEARSGQFSNGNPPLMAAEWYVLDRIISGPILMLLLQGTLFLGGLYVLLRRFMSDRAAAWTAIGVLLFPPVLTPMAVMWKDSQMAAYLVAGTAALVQPRLRTRLIGLGLLTAACAFRHNAFAAVVPLVFFIFEWKPGMRWWRRFAILGVAALLVVAATFVVSRMLTVQQVKITPAFHDIVGVIAFADEMSDEELRETLRGTPLVVTTGIQAHARKIHFARGAWRVVHGDDKIFEYPKTDAEWAALYRAWKELALGHPLAYLAAHWDRYEEMLGGSVRTRATVWNLYLEERESMFGILHYASHSWFQVQAGRVLNFLADDTPMFRPWIYAVIALLLIALCCRDRITFGIYTSGLLYELSFFPAFAEPDFRYSHWMITSTVVATIIIFVQRRKARTA